MKAALALTFVLASCASSLPMTPEQATTCADPREQCRVMSITELRRWFDAARAEGYEAGKKSI